MSRRRLRELVWETPKQTQQCREPTEDAAAARFEGGAARLFAEDHELQRRPIDLAMAPVTPVGKIVIWQELLTVDPPPCPRTRSAVAAPSR